MSNNIQWVIFRIGLAVFMFAAFSIATDSAPDLIEASETPDFASMIEWAIDDYELNEKMSETAPQQTVVNGWVNRDLLHIIALQNDAAAKNLAIGSNQDDRPVKLLVVLVFTVAWVGLWTGNPKVWASDGLALKRAGEINRPPLGKTLNPVKQMLEEQQENKE